MAETANVLGVPATFAFEGQNFKVGPVTLQVEGEMERHLQRLSLECIQQMRSQLRPDEFRMMLDGHRRDCATGVFTWGSEACMQFLSTVEGVKHFAMLRLADSNREEEDPPVEPELVERLWQDSAAWEMLRIVCETVDGDPNRTGTAKA